MKIAICEDDAISRKQVLELVEEFIRGKELSVHAFSRPSALLEEACRIDGFDIYILDILMPEFNGIQLGLRLRQTGFNGKILYLTASRDFAVDAFKVNASGYLLKPVRRQELFSKLEELYLDISAQRKKSLIVKTKENSLKLHFDSIIYAELVKKTVIFHLLGGRTVESTSIRSTFSEAMQELLRDKRFALCGSARLVNLHYVAEMDGETLRFRDGHSLFIGRRAGRALKSVWYDFWFERGNTHECAP